jgi:hypothetical protein
MMFQVSAISNQRSAAICQPSPFSDQTSAMSLRPSSFSETRKAGKAAPRRLRSAGPFGVSGLAEALEVKYHLAPRVRLEGRDEARSPDDLVMAVGVANVDGLKERVVECFDQNQDLGLLPREVLGRLAPQRARLSTSFAASS